MATLTLHWDEPDDVRIRPSVSCIEKMGEPGWEILNLFEEAAAYRMVGDQRIFCENIFPIFEARDPVSGYFDCANPINLVNNLPNDFDRESVSYTYEIEIKSGVISIYSYLEPDITIRIGVPDFVYAHTRYCEVRKSKQLKREFMSLPSLNKVVASP